MRSGGSRRGRATLLAGLGVLAVVGMVAALPAFACTPTSNIASRPARAEAGTVINIDGFLFDPEGTAVTIKWGAASNGIVLATATVAPDGTFTQPVTIPGDSYGGRYQISAYQRYPVRDAGGNKTGAENFRTTTTTIDVIGPPKPEAAPPAQEAPQQETQPAPAPVTEATQPAQAPQTAPKKAVQPKAVQPAPAAPAEPAPAETAAAEPAPAPAAESPAPVAPPAVEPLPVGVPVLGVPRAVDVGPSPWLIVPLAVIGLALFSAGLAIFVHELRQRSGAEV